MKSTKEIQEILGHYYKTPKTGIFFWNKDKTVCFCGKTYEGDGQCPSCGKKSLIRVSGKELGKKRVVSTIKNNHFSIVEYRLQIKLMTEDLEGDYKEEFVDVIEKPHSSIKIDNGVINSNISGGKKTSDAFNKLFFEDLAKYSPWATDYLSSLNQVNVSQWGFRTDLSRAICVDKLYPKLKVIVNTNNLNEALRVFLDKAIAYDESKEVEDMLSVKKPYLRIFQSCYLENFKKLSKETTEIEAEMIVSYMENRNDRSYYSSFYDVLMFANAKDYGFQSIKDLMEFADKSQRYHPELFCKVIKEYSEEYSSLYNHLPEYNLDIPLNSKDTGRISRMYSFKKSYKLPTDEIEAIMKLIQDNPSEGLKKLGTYPMIPPF